ncbi:hypothetical protein LPJ73_005382, partial [Coemansia sp. RSA 2703]
MFNSSKPGGGHERVATSDSESDARDSRDSGSVLSFTDYVDTRLEELGWSSDRRRKHSTSSDPAQRPDSLDNSIRLSSLGESTHERDAASPPPQEFLDATSGASMVSSFFNLTNAIVGAG